MSTSGTKANITSINQNLFVDLNEKSAETISGGALEIFSVANQTRNVNINRYYVDRKASRLLPGRKNYWYTYKGGIIRFDSDFGRKGNQEKRYNLRNGRKYAFRLNTRTPYKYDIDLYDVGAL